MNSFFNLWYIFGALILFGLWIIFNAGNDNSRKLAGQLQKTITNTLTQIMGIWSNLLSAVKITKLIEIYIKTWTDEKIQKWMQSYFSKSSDPMVSASWNTRLELAQKLYPREKYPTLWIKDIPEDLRRSLISDGRIITGDPISKAAEASVTLAHQGFAWRSGVGAAILWFSLLFVVWHPALVANFFAVSNSTQVAEKISQMTDDQVALSAKQNFWTQAEKQAAVASVRSQSVSAPKNYLHVLLMSFIDPIRLLLPLFFAGLMGILTFKATIASVLAQTGKYFQEGTKEQTVRWKKRLAERQNEYIAHCAQVKRAITWDDTPMIKFADATGTMRSRGKLDAPYKNSPIQMSIMDLCQNTMVIGGTGQGKTRTMLIPTMNSIIDISKLQDARAVTMRIERGLPGAIPKIQSATTANDFQYPFGIKPRITQNADGTWSSELIEYPSSYSILVSDGKAVLYDDLQKIARKQGVLNKMLVIGAEPHEFAIDLLDGISPQLFSDTIKSVAKQLGGAGKSDSFWPDMAAKVVRDCAVLARVFDLTPEGLMWAQTYKERPYSLIFIYQLSVDSGPLVFHVLDAIFRTLENPALSNNIKEFATKELEDATKYISESWLKLVQATRDGIIANIVNVMGGFSSHVALRHSFAAGAGEKLISVDQLWGHFTATNISTTTYGTAGRIINVFIKTLFMTEAINRQKQTTDQMAALEARIFSKFPELSNIVNTYEAIYAKRHTMNASARKVLDAWTDSLTLALDSIKRIAQARNISIDDYLCPMIQLERYLDRLITEPGALKELEPLLMLVQRCENDFRDNFIEYSTEVRLLSDFVDDLSINDKKQIDKELYAKVCTDREALEDYLKWRILSTKITKREKIFFIADEYQTLVTVDTSEGAFSDSNFWNVSRSAGVAGIIATQALSTLKQAIGDSYENFVQMMRSKICLPVEDLVALELMKKLSGKTLRSHVYDSGEFESYDAMLFETDFKDPFLYPSAQRVEIQDNNPLNLTSVAAGVGQLFSIGKAVTSADVITNVDKSFHVDNRFMLTSRTVTSGLAGTGNNIDQAIGARQAAVWRAEDKRKSQLSEGNHDEDVFHEDEFLAFGQNHAFFFIQRSGKAIVDYGKLAA